ncbi:MAG: corrinoid protein [Candidatus Promineifilaceae bacterium]|jgi:5-methyltetrahydrofolate--homocysteine methyltransferase
MDSAFEDLYECIIEGDMGSAPELVQEALDKNIAPAAVLNECMIPAMTEVGRLFEEGDYFVPEMLISARAMQAGLGVLKPHLVESGVEPIGKVVIGTVQGDMHDIGKNLVAMMMEGAGFEIIDLGVDVSPDAFIEAIQANDAGVIAMSALLTTTMPKMKVTIDAINEAGIRDNVRIMIGGAPVTADYAEQVGADGYAPDASQAASKVKTFVD